MLTKSQIFKAGNKLKTKVIDVPEWGGKVTIREMTAFQRDELERFILAVGGGRVENLKSDSYRARIIAYTVVDDKGKLVFSDLDIPDICKMGGAGVVKVASESLYLSRMGEDDEEESEELGNSESTPDEDSPSDSVKS